MKNWFNKLKTGLSTTSQRLEVGLKKAFIQKKLTTDVLENLEDLLIQADLGAAASAKIIEAIKKEKFDDAKDALAALNKIGEVLTSILEVSDKVFLPLKDQTTVVMMLGVNGSGKTTTTAKLAHLYAQKGYRVSMVACDTFRAAATEQLVMWGNRLGIHVYQGKPKMDPAALAYESCQQALQKKEEIVFIDTAGRLHTNADLMQELAKIERTIKKLHPTGAFEGVLVLDGTVGQNAYQQVELFSKATSLTGLVMTKLDGTAKGGTLVGLADRFKLPFYALGLGEQADDLQNFSIPDFVNALLGLEKK